MISRVVRMEGRKKKWIEKGGWKSWWMMVCGDLGLCVCGGWLGILVFLKG